MPSDLIFSLCSSWQIVEVTPGLHHRKLWSELCSLTSDGHLSQQLGPHKNRHMKENRASQAKKTQIPSSQCRFFQSAHFVRSRDHTGQFANKIFASKAMCKAAIVPLAHIKTIKSPDGISTYQCTTLTLCSPFMPSSFPTTEWQKSLAKPWVNWCQGRCNLANWDLDNI